MNITNRKHHGSREAIRVASSMSMPKSIHAIQWSNQLATWQVKNCQSDPITYIWSLKNGFEFNLKDWIHPYIVMHVTFDIMDQLPSNLKILHN